MYVSAFGYTHRAYDVYPGDFIRETKGASKVSSANTIGIPPPCVFRVSSMCTSENISPCNSRISKVFDWWLIKEGKEKSNR